MFFFFYIILFLVLTVILSIIFIPAVFRFSPLSKECHAFTRIIVEISVRVDKKKSFTQSVVTNYFQFPKNTTKFFSGFCSF